MARVNFTSIPFKIEANSGFTKADGLAKFSPAGIILEFEKKLLGLISSGVEEARLPIEEILDIRFKKGFFKYLTKIEIRMNSYLKLSEVPNQNGKITLKIPRDQHERAREAVEQLLKNLDEYRRRALLPPPQTPVRSLFEPEETETDPLQTNELETGKLDSK